MHDVCASTAAEETGRGWNLKGTSSLPNQTMFVLKEVNVRSSLFVLNVRHVPLLIVSLLPGVVNNNLLYNLTILLIVMLAN